MEAVRVVVVVVLVLHLVVPVGGALCRVAKHAGAAAALRLACAAVCRPPTSRCFGHPINHPHLTSPRLTSPRQRLLSYFLLSPPFVLFFCVPQSQEKPTEGVVVSMGPGKTHPETGVPVDLPCAVGDKVREVGRRFVFLSSVGSSGGAAVDAGPYALHAHRAARRMIFQLLWRWQRCLGRGEEG